MNAVEHAAYTMYARTLTMLAIAEWIHCRSNIAYLLLALYLFPPFLMGRPFSLPGRHFPKPGAVLPPMSVKAFISNLKSIYRIVTIVTMQAAMKSQALELTSHKQ